MQAKLKYFFKWKHKFKKKSNPKGNMLVNLNEYDLKFNSDKKPNKQNQNWNIPSSKCLIKYSI
jgi:hypothetical protein